MVKGGLLRIGRDMFLIDGCFRVLVHVKRLLYRRRGGGVLFSLGWTFVVRFDRIVKRSASVSGGPRRPMRVHC